MIIPFQSAKAFQGREQLRITTRREIRPPGAHLKEGIPTENSALHHIAAAADGVTRRVQDMNAQASQRDDVAVGDRDVGL